MRKIIYLSIVLVITLVGCNDNSNNKEKSKGKANIINVKSEKITDYKGEKNRKYSGVIEAKDKLPLSFVTTGTVTHVYVEEGQRVKKGKLLAKLNTSNAQNMYVLASAKQTQAQDAYNRLKPMKENGTLPEIKWIEVETGLNQANAATAIAKKRVSDCNLIAPTSGVIGKKNIQVGMNVLPINTVLNILNITNVHVKASVPENEINYLKKGDTATVYISALSKTFTGPIREIGVSADMFSHSYPVKIVLPNLEFKIKPGMVCSVKINSKSNMKGYLITNKALQVDGNGQFVYVENGNTVSKKKIKTIELIGDKVLVQGDIKSGDNIITAGQKKLEEGASVNIIK